MFNVHRLTIVSDVSYFCIDVTYCSCQYVVTANKALRCHVDIMPERSLPRHARRAGAFFRTKFSMRPRHGAA